MHVLGAMHCASQQRKQCGPANKSDTIVKRQMGSKRCRTGGDDLHAACILLVQYESDESEKSVIC